MCQIEHSSLAGKNLYREMRIPRELKMKMENVDLKRSGHFEVSIEAYAKDTTAQVRVIPRPDLTVRILLVDDQPVILKRVRAILAERLDFEVCGEAHDGASGVEEALRLKPHAVVLNVSMPILDGFAAARAIKAKVPTTAIVILSTEADKHFVAEARKCGANAYVVKTKAAESLVAAIDGALTGGEFVLLD
jgi:CheY-like chemotaxis protein